MAQDPQLERRIGSARRFDLLLSILTPEQREIAINGSDDQLTPILQAKGVRDIAGVFLTKRDWLSLRNYVEETQKDEKIAPEKKSELLQSLTNAGIGLAILGLMPKDKKHPQASPPPQPQPQTRMEMMQKAGEAISKPASAEDLAKKSEWGEIEPAIPAISLENKKTDEDEDQPQSLKLEDLTDSTDRQIVDTTPKSEPPREAEIAAKSGYYPADENVIGEIDDWGIPEPIAKTISEPTIITPPPAPTPQPPQSSPTLPINKMRSSVRIGRSTRAAGAARTGARAGATGARVAAGLAATSEVWVPAVIVVLVIFFIFLIVAILGCSVVNNPIGDFLGANYCGLHPESTKPPSTTEKATSITFVGGEAYLQTSDGCRVNCPAGKKGDKTTVQIVVNIDWNKLDTDPDRLTASLQIDKNLFSQISTTGGPKEIVVPVALNYSIYQWKIPNNGKNQYVFDISGKNVSDGGSSTLILTMGGITLTTENSTSTNANSGLYAGANSRPTTDTCNKYGDIMKSIQKDFPKSTATNYGDPLCTYTNAKLRAVIEQTEKNQANWDMWTSIAKCEAGSPNGYSRAADGGGAWGKFQMRRSFADPFKPWTGPTSRGDVTWQKQVVNAVDYNNGLNQQGKNFSYWGTARCLCYYDKYKKTSACKDILRRGEIRTPNSGKCSICTASEGAS